MSELSSDLGLDEKKDQTANINPGKPHTYNQNNDMDDIYCQEIIPGKLPVEVVFETDHVMAFHHTKPYWERHVVIIPKAHIASLSTYPNDAALNRDFFEAIRVVCKLFEDSYGGCRISSNVGNYQTSKHLHWYVHQGKRLVDESEDPVH